MRDFCSLLLKSAPFQQRALFPVTNQKQDTFLISGLPQIEFYLSQVLENKWLFIWLYVALDKL